MFLESESGLDSWLIIYSYVTLAKLLNLLEPQFLLLQNGDNFCLAELVELNERMQEKHLAQEELNNSNSQCSILFKAPLPKPCSDLG